MPGCNISFTDWCDVKDISKKHGLNGRLGGGKILQRHFTSLTFNDLKTTFDPTGSDDEFIAIFNKVQSMSKEA